MSVHPPVISNVALQGAPNPVSGVVTLGWTASDADGDTLSFDVSYSRDNGGPFGKVTVAWMKWHLLGDESASAKGMFVGNDKPEVIDDEPWVTDSKHLK